MELRVLGIESLTANSRSPMMSYKRLTPVVAVNCYNMSMIPNKQKVIVLRMPLSALHVPSVLPQLTHVHCAPANLRFRRLLAILFGFIMKQHMSLFIAPGINRNSIQAEDMGRHVEASPSVPLGAAPFSTEPVCTVAIDRSRASGGRL